nr:tetratricopeptide repeat protein [Ardenticatena sp.]
MAHQQKVPLLAKNGAGIVEHFLKAREGIYNPTDTATFDEARQRLQTLAHTLLRDVARYAADASVFYWLAQIDYTIAESYLWAEDHGNAQRFFESTIKHSIRAIRQQGDMADVHRLLGECIGRLIPLKGWLFATVKAKQALTALRTALGLDDQNGRAYIALSTYYLFAPPVFGGNLGAAVESLQRSFSCPLTHHEDFLASFWMAYALSKTGASDEAQEYLARALSLYPNNYQALHLQEHLRGR